MRTVEQAMGEDLVTLAERCDKLEAENARLKADGQRTVDEYKNLLEHYQTVEAEVARLKESLRTWAPLNEAKAEVAAWRGRFESYRFNGRDIVPARAALAGKD